VASRLLLLVGPVLWFFLASWATAQTKKETKEDRFFTFKNLEKIVVEGIFFFWYFDPDRIYWCLQYNHGSLGSLGHMA
jgi:hypothetical protein